MKHKNLRNRLLSLVCTGALALSLLPGAALAAGAAAPAETRNEGGTYNGNWAIPVRSYLYQDGQNLVRVEYDPGQKIYNVNTGQTTVTRPEQVVVETYDASFQLQDTVTLGAGAAAVGRLLRRGGLQLPDLRPGEPQRERQHRGHPGSEV